MRKNWDEEEDIIMKELPEVNARKRDGGRSLTSHVAVTKTYKRIDHFIRFTTLWFRELSRLWSISGSFNHEWTNDTNLFHFSIRVIRLFVIFVISTPPIPHRHNSSTRCPAYANYRKTQKNSIYSTITMGDSI